MAKLTQIELNLGYCEEAQTYCSVAEERYKLGRQNAERDFQNSDYWNDYLAKVIKDAKADVIDEFYNRLLMYKNEINASNYPWNYIELVAREMTKQLKE